MLLCVIIIVTTTTTATTIIVQPLFDLQGHEKVIRYLVKHVNQFPSDSELTRYIHTLSDSDHAKKCEKCVEAIITAKEEQANKAIKNADKLLEEIDAEKVG